MQFLIYDMCSFFVVTKSSLHTLRSVVHTANKEIKPCFKNNGCKREAKNKERFGNHHPKKCSWLLREVVVYERLYKCSDLTAEQILVFWI